MIIDHVGIYVADYEESKQFYNAALAPLGIKLIMEGHGWMGYGKKNKPEFWMGVGRAEKEIHIAFEAANRKQVDAFYQAAMDAGAINNGEPGIREEYHKDYYGAFVIDPNGYNIEAVCHKP